MQAALRPISNALVACCLLPVLSSCEAELVSPGGGQQSENSTANLDGGAAQPDAAGQVDAPFAMDTEPASPYPDLGSDESPDEGSAGSEEDAEPSVDAGNGTAPEENDAGSATGPANGFKLAPDGFLVRNADGKRFFPLAMWGVPTSENATAKAFGVNTVGHFSGELSRDKPWLTALGEAGMYGIPALDVDQVEDLSESAAKAKARELAAGLAALPGEPAMMYQLPDEGITLGLSASMLKAVSDGFKAGDPGTLVVYDEYEVSSVIAAKDSYDILCSDTYPNYEAVEIEPYRERVRELRAAAAPKAFWQALITWAGVFTGNTWAELTLDELRVSAYVGITAGASGLIAWAWDDDVFEAHPDLYEATQSLFKELSRLGPVLALPKAPNSIKVGKKGVDVLLKRDDAVAGRFYLIAVNYLDGSNLSNGHHAGTALPGVSFTIGDISGAATAKVIAGGEGTLRLSNGVLTDSLPAYGAKVYQIDAAK